MIPIVIMHRNEFENLFLMINRITKETVHPYKLFIVDNNSNVLKKDEYIKKLKKLDLIFIESKKNNWILAFNLALKHRDWPKDAKYYIFSDADILVPEKDEAGCWLSKLIKIMDENACIGKLGLSLRVSDIDFWNKDFVVTQYEFFQRNPKIGRNVIAPVDTTLAIYRKDYFLDDDFKFSIGHASLARPFYYCCRTSAELEAVHLGWYEKYRIKHEDKAFSEKIRCFSRLGCYVDPLTLDKARWFDKIYYKTIRPAAYFYYGSLVAIKIIFYFLKKFPRRMNEIQFLSRGDF